MSDDWKGEEKDPASLFSQWFLGRPLTPEERAEAKRRSEERQAQATIAPMMLPVFDPERGCAKCGHDTAKVRYCLGGQDGWECFTKAGTEEHFHRTCKRCRYVWYEQTRPEVS